MKKKILCLTVVMCMVMTLFSAVPVTATEDVYEYGFTPSITTTYNNNWVNVDFSTNNTMEVRGRGGSERYAYIKFEIPEVASGDIVRATLVLTTSSVKDEVASLTTDCTGVYNNDWIASDVIVKEGFSVNLPEEEHDTVYISAQTVSDANTEYTWDVTDYIKSDADGNYTFKIHDKDAVEGTVIFYAKNSDYEPRLVIESTSPIQIASGECGDDLTWTLDNTGVLTISGEGEMYDYTSSNVPWCNYKTTIKKITVEEGITSIGKRAFYDCSSTTILLPETLKSIGSYSFSCAVESIKLPDSLETIADYAFFASELTSITIPKGVNSIGKDVFLFCNNLEEINVSENNKWYASIEGNLYSKNKSMLIMYAFGKKESKFTVPDGVTVIYDYAFSGNTNIVEVVLPDSVKRIGNSAFIMCENLESVNLPSGLTIIDEYAFSDCTSLSKVVIPGSVKNISEYSFNGCRSLSELVIVGGVESIGYGAFCSCTSLESLVLPNGVNSIGEYAFESCRNLKSVVIPNSVTSISNVAFRYCDELTDVYYTGSEEEWNDIEISSGNDDLTNATIHFNYVPNEIIYGDATGDGEINVNDVVLLVEYIGTLAAGGDFDLFEIPGGTDCLDVTGDGEINVNDAVLLVEYIGTKSAGGTLDESKFPGGTFPGAVK